MLDDASKRALEAYAERMAAKSSRSATLRSRKILQHSPSFQQYKELSSKLHFINTIYPTLEPSSSSSEPQNRKKRRRICEESSFKQLVAPNQINVGLTDIYPSPNRQIDVFSWPQNFTFQSSRANEFIQGIESKNSSYLTKNHGQLSRKSASGTRKSLNNADYLALDRDRVGSQRKDVEKCTDFSKEIEDAISRIESLIPLLQELVNSVQEPEEKRVGKLGMPIIYSSLNPVKQDNDGVIRTNELGLTDKSGALEEYMVGKQVSQMMTKCNLPTPSRVKWSKSVKCVDDHPKTKEENWSDVNMTLVMGDKPQNFVSAHNHGRTRNLELEKISHAKISQVPRRKAKAIMSRPESLKRTPSKTESSASHYPESVQGLRIMPQSNHEEAIEKDATLSPCTEVVSVGSTSSTDHSSTSSVDSSHQKWSRNHTSRRIAQEKNLPAGDSLKRYSKIRKVVPHDQISEETSRSSSASSSVTAQETGESSSSTGTYQSFGTDDSYDSDESDPHQKKAGCLRGKEPEVSESNQSGYYDDTPSYDNSRDEYSDTTVPSSFTSSVRARKWDLQKQRREKARGRIRRLGKKIGMIFHHHHHHHHHHHYGDKDEPDVHARSIWKRFGEMFHHTRNADHLQKKFEAENSRKSEAEKSKKSDVKTLVKKKDQIGQFHALVGGVMKHSKKTKQVKNGIKGLGNGHSGGKKKGNKLPWWPKFHGGRGGVKVPNKGKIKFQNFYRTKSLAAAKMILGKKK